MVHHVPPRSRWLFITPPLVLILLVVGWLMIWKTCGTAFSSPPDQLRPWAEVHYRELIRPIPSTGKPMDPAFTATHGGIIPWRDSGYQMKVVVEPASQPFVPKYEVIEFTADEGFTSPSGSGKIRWLATRPYDLPVDSDHDPGTSVLTLFHPDGKPMAADESRAMGVTLEEVKAWGFELRGEGGTALKGSLEVSGFMNPQWKFQDVLDTNTHASVLQQCYLRPGDGGLGFGASLSTRHDSPLILVIDVAHGETLDFDIPLSKGSKVTHQDFGVDILDVFPGRISQGRRMWIKPGRTLEQYYADPSFPPEPGAFSTIYQINPSVMNTAVSLDALDSCGRFLQHDKPFMEDAPVLAFKGDLSSASGLRVRYRPHLTRLLIRMGSLPGVPEANLKPLDLFDVQSPMMVFSNSLQMRRFISTGTQLKDVTTSWSGDDDKQFPIVFKNATPRQVAERYLALDHGRRIKIDSKVLTIEFEPAKKPSWITKIRDWMRSRHWL